MAQIDTGGNSNSKQKKMNARVDFTPMVDFLHALYYSTQTSNDGNHYAFGQG